MNTTRQDAWTKDEDIILAETVLRYIREGRTQLEAFNEVAKKLSRTSAACGFRWNATIRKQYESAIQFAKEERKQGGHSNGWQVSAPNRDIEKDPIDTAILLLKNMKLNASEQCSKTKEDYKSAVQQLEKENKYLKEQLSRYDEAWMEMEKLWNWVKKKNND